MQTAFGQALEELYSNNNTISADFFLYWSSSSSSRNLNDSNDVIENSSKIAFTFVDFMVVFAGGLCLMFCIVVLIHFGAILLEKCLTGRPFSVARESRSSSDNNNAPQDDGSRVSQQANLFGLQESERKRILQRLFDRTTFRYADSSPCVDDDASDNNVKCNIVPRGDESSDTDEAEAGNTRFDDTQKEISSRTQSAMPRHGGRQGKNASSTNKYYASTGTCSICLIPYQPGDRVLQGLDCDHRFHAACCHQWLMQNNDQCPYCRTDMMTAHDFRLAAITVLGEKRVQELSRVAGPPNKGQIAESSSSS
jgi:Ring finger domain